MLSIFIFNKRVFIIFNTILLLVYIMRKKRNFDNNLFYDLGIVNSRRKNYKNDMYKSYGDILIKYSKKGTTVYSKTNDEGFYYINQELDKDLNYEFSFKWVDGNFITPIIQIRQVHYMDRLISFQKQYSDVWEIYSNVSETNDWIDCIGTKTFSKQKLSKGNQIKFIKKGNIIKVYCENKLVINYPLKFNSNFFIGFGGHSFGDRFTTFRDVSLKQIR